MIGPDTCIVRAHLVIIGANCTIPLLNGLTLFGLGLSYFGSYLGQTQSSGHLKSFQDRTGWPTWIDYTIACGLKIIAHNIRCLSTGRSTAPNVAEASFEPRSESPALIRADPIGMPSRAKANPTPVPVNLGTILVVSSRRRLVSSAIRRSHFSLLTQPKPCTRVMRLSRKVRRRGSSWWDHISKTAILWVRSFV